MERRDFIKMFAAGIIAASAPWWLKKTASAEEEKLGAKPKLKLIFHYGAHGTAEDAEKIGELVEKVRPHIYVSEFFGRESEKEKMLARRKKVRTASDPSETLKEMYLGGCVPFFRKEIEILNRHALPETMLELASGDDAEKLAGIEKKRDKLEEESYDFFGKGEPEKALERFEKSMASRGEHSVIRDKLLVSGAEKLLKNLVAEFPGLAKEKEIRVLVRIGSVHTNPYVQLRKKGFAAERYFDYSPYYFGSPAEIMRSTIFGTRKPGRDKVAKAFLEGWLQHSLPSRNMNKANAAASIILAKSGYNDFAEISKKLLAQEEIFKRQPMMQRYSDAIQNHLRRKGITLPSTEKEMDELLRKHYPKMKFGLWRASAPTRERI